MWSAHQWSGLETQNVLLLSPFLMFKALTLKFLSSVVQPWKRLESGGTLPFTKQTRFFGNYRDWTRPPCDCCTTDFDHITIQLSSLTKVFEEGNLFLANWVSTIYGGWSLAPFPKYTNTVLKNTRIVAAALRFRRLSPQSDQFLVGGKGVTNAVFHLYWQLRTINEILANSFR